MGIKVLATEESDGYYALESVQDVDEEGRHVGPPYLRIVCPEGVLATGTDYDKMLELYQEYANPGPSPSP